MKIKQAGSNQTILRMGTAEILFSYETPVAGNIEGQFVKTEKFHSVTTSKHINKYLDGRPAAEKPQEYFNQILETEMKK